MRSNGNHHDDKSALSPCCFPIGRTVPFPYETPYEQQVDLMDAVLRSLHQKQQQQQQQISNDGKENKSSSSSSSSNNNRSNNKNKTRLGAAIMMLESPTGTGKSLSLACASMSWLRHIEASDLKASASVKKTISKSDTTPNSNNTLSWLDEWVPPSERDNEQHEKDGRQRAQDARSKLEEELNSLRTKLKIMGDNNQEEPKHEDLNGLRERRVNLVRSAVTASKMAERKKQKNKGKRLRQVQQQPDQQKKQSLSLGGDVVDYCLEDYYSDDNLEGCSSKTDYDIDVDDDDLIGNRNKNADHFSSPSVHASLIDGGSLDGSGVKKYYYNQEHQQGTNTSCCGHDKEPFTIGSVKPGSGVRKIIYAARTHSQLSQFVGELRRTKWGSNLRVVALGGRQILCSNPDVNGKNHKYPKSEASITESCLDLQKGKKGTKTTTNSSTGRTTDGSAVGLKRKSTNSATTKDTKGCPLLSSKDAGSTLALHILAQPSDIEDAARLGASSSTCAYYASREALTAAEVVVLPYSMLLSKSARQAVGLSLKQSFVVVDEAHNLPEAIRGLHSCKLSLTVVEAASDQILAYLARYSSRLAGRNLFYLGQIRKCLNAFVKQLSKKAVPQDKEKEDGHNVKKMMSTTELLINLKLDNVNIFKILTYLESSQLCRKLMGFMDVTAGKVNEDDNGEHTGLSKHVSPLSVVQTFLSCLTSTSGEGKVVIDWPSSPHQNGSRSRNVISCPTLRYVLLQPSTYFENILEEAHAVALVGGTLRPFAHVASELLGSNSSLVEEASKADNLMESTTKKSTTYVSPNLTVFTCDHVIPQSNVIVSQLSTGPSNAKLDFRHQSRSTTAVCDEMGRTLINICKVVPSGVVVFLPSYSYEAHLIQRWKATGLLSELTRYKKVHREPKSSKQIEVALESYSKDATEASVGGAVLFSVVGGKMSEGINFADDMARCVMVVGLPYPDITDPELKEKMSSIDHLASTKKASHGGGNLVGRHITGQTYYQNLCMRAVNQSIGRAIRHANDYAAIVLCDARYNSDPRISRGLPQWIRRSSDNEGHGQQPNFGKEMHRLNTFFNSHIKR